MIRTAVRLQPVNDDDERVNDGICCVFLFFVVVAAPWYGTMLVAITILVMFILGP